MSFMFGTFPQIKLARNNEGGGDGIIDLTDLNTAIVFSEDHTVEPAQRYSQWHLSAESTTLYQNISQPNQIIIGEAGNIYVLDENEGDDDGAGIPVTIETGPLPPASQEYPIASLKRLHEVWWAVATLPPAIGHKILLKIIDQDYPNNTRVISVTQFTQIIRVQITIIAKQFRIQWKVVPSTDFDMVNSGCSFQVIEGPYASITSE
jgi:hypothetical protein